MAIEPFKIDIPESTLKDLRERLARTRWPDDFGNDQWQYGGHFAPMEEPETLVADIRNFFRTL